MNEPAIVTESITKSFKQIRAVDGLSLCVPPGVVYGFLGRNGAGKTTTIRILMGLARASDGNARVLGLEVGRQQVAILRRTGFVAENKVLYDDLTPAQLVRFNAGFYPNWSQAAVEKYARLFEIPMTQKYGQLSLGNRAKVYLLLALAQPADLLVLDEPVLGVDPVVAEQILRAIGNYVAEGKTVFYSSHQLFDVEQIADWVGVIDQGRLLLEARLEDIKRDYRTVIAAGNNLPAGSRPQIISATPRGQFTRYLVASQAEAFAAGLRQQGAREVEVFPLNLREIFLELVPKEQADTRMPEVLR
jgi:ABC-2 type transport system ATP-binding protein